MIYTCTITPSIDYTTYLPEFKTGKLNRSDEVYFYPGGKGINVSRVLKRLEVESTAIAFAGGFTGTYIEQFLINEGIKTDFIPTDEITRINVKIKSTVETELNGPGPTLLDEHLQLLFEKVRQMKAGDWFVLAGRLTDSIPTSFFEEIAMYCNANRIHFVLDTSGPALKELVRLKPLLIKPNVDELGELFETEITSTQEAVKYARNLVDQGVEHVIVSMGGEGALLVTKDLIIKASVPTKQVVNTVGSGDSLVSGFIASYMTEQDATKAFRYGVASGSATAFQSDLCERDDVEALLDQVLLNPLFEQDVKK
ncbi:1-phosphofructokinase [Paenisporosarcina quisquiliarum]|uniref:Tagatose-6-phosphate kinase n=1 Tax=Paenisporosarcina quisquiliarum TaxID=365346 RepID=A0A9X3RD12_9BACL|nr:1-phosphofructokinase [Paenisporosarcina quisquiliarum]MCZ8535953.1 1-phosphofructokinase [Paenisporosarcina quisquiliarum]